MKSIFEYLSRFIKNIHEGLDTVILIGDTQGLRKQEKLKFL